VKKASFFNFVVKRLRFLKRVPYLTWVFDAWLRLWLILIASEIAGHIDALEMEINSWPGVSVGLHKYGGLQFNYHHKEIGHIHGNGLLDIRFSRAVKAKLLADGKVINHHVFTDSGWISFYVRNADDQQYAIILLNLAYRQLFDKKITAQTSGYFFIISI
jgi:hypothetical protein